MPRDQLYTVVFTLQGRLSVFFINEYPNLYVCNMASLVLAPNELVPIKDRFGIFKPSLYPVMTSEEVEAEIQRIIRDEGDKSDPS